MRRLELQEIHDHPRFPSFLRNLVTDAMQSLWSFGNTYKPILPRLLDGMDRAGSQEVLDLCSGGGGPWLRLSREPKLQKHPEIVVRLTDKYPNMSAFERAGEASALIRFERDSVNAERIPASLRGFRTVFSSFHHFGPEAARRLLGDAVTRAEGVGIFELAQRSLRTVLTICFIPALVLMLAPSIRPFRWSRLLWTYLIPAVPFVVFYDGLASCLRAYSLVEMEELVQPLRSTGYSWEIGEERSGFLPVTYLIGVPATAPPNH